MHPFPHRYLASAAAKPTGDITLASPGLAEIASAPPREFDGPGDHWSPETLLVAALGDCFVLTFRAVARAAHYEWRALACNVTGTLERPDQNSRFTKFVIEATLRVPAGSDLARAELLLAKAEHGCLISNSLTGDKSLVVRIEVSD